VPTESHELPDCDATQRSYQVLSLELTHLRSALSASPYPLVALHALVLVALQEDIGIDDLAEQLGLDSKEMGQLVHALVRLGSLRATRHAKTSLPHRLKLTV